MSWIVFTGEGLSPVRSRDGELFRRRQVSSSSNMVGATRLLLADLAAHGEAGNAAAEQRVKTQAIALCERFPIY